MEHFLFKNTFALNFYSAGILVTRDCKITVARGDAEIGFWEPLRLIERVMRKATKINRTEASF
jgi:hypothetical protein